MQNRKTDSDITMIIPVYNAEKYIDRCLSSLLGQSFDNFVMYLVDDGSKDSSYERLKEYQEKYPERITVFHKENGGAASARNYALNYLDTPYVMFCDIDDYVENDFVEKLYRAITESIADMAVCAYERNGNVASDGEKGYSGVISIEDNPDFVTDVIVIVSNKIYRSDLWKKESLRFPEGVIYEDAALIPLITARCQKIVLIDDVLYHYMDVENSVMHRQNGHEKDFFQILDYMNQDGYRNKYPEQYQYLSMSYMFGVIITLIRRKAKKKEYERVYQYIRKYGCNWKGNSCFERHKARSNSKGRIFHWILLKRWLWAVKLIIRLKAKKLL